MTEPKKRDTWKQDSPFFQYRVLLMAIHGNLDNALEGINPQKGIERSIEVIEQLRELEYFLQNPEKWA